MSQSSGYHRLLKVLFVNHTGKVGGAEASLLTLLNALASLHSDKVELAIAAPEDGHLLKCASAIGVRTIPTRRIKRLRRPRRANEIAITATTLLCGLVESIRVLREISPHIVHCNSLQCGVYFSIPTVLMGIPMVWHCRDVLMPHLAAKIVGMRSNAIIAISKSVAKVLSAHSLPEFKIHTIYNAVDTAQLEGAKEVDVRDFRTRCGVPEGGLLVGMVAHIVPWKRHDIFIKAASIISQQRDDVRFVIVGGDIFDEHELWLGYLMQLRSELSLKEKLTFAGAQNDMAVVMNAIDILVHPTPMEPFGRAVAEAMAAGKAVVAINAFGPAELISDGENGLLVSSPTPEEIAHAILRLIDDASLRESVGRMARKFVAEHLSPQFHANSVLKLWIEVLGKSSF
ncbi:MAG: glycosyltransferase family 4 protein [Armatimonadota bacterium]|nr:glycosyltransferase family 4 protein [Armatimonadota bacterium]MCX7777080.1 glycosyltransferase family 4 protein [Armatimonadota bacterium]MDW8025127.1 glycosyltransferase family 4 protein [Armatimonadota bacterium]